jgi:hypothetical protein
LSATNLSPGSSLFKCPPELYSQEIRRAPKLAHAYASRAQAYATREDYDRAERETSFDDAEPGLPEGGVWEMLSPAEV